MWLRIFITSLALLALTGCKGFIQNNINEANDNPASGLSQFEGALERGYLDLAQGEVSEDDFRDSNYFLRRSIAIRRGQTVNPTALDERNFTPENRAKAQRARSALVDFINGPMRQSRPAIVAQAQVMFDCWVQELEENRQPRDISLCEEAFLSAMGGLEGFAAGSASGAVELSGATVSATGASVVYFAFDRFNLISEGRDALMSAAADAADKSVVSVVITASADSSGSFRYNQTLSQKRGEYVRDILVNSGIPASKIAIVALGENYLPVATGDGVKEPRNRRAEVEFLF